MSKKIVYITGCLGFIGSHLTKACLDRGWYVRGVDKLTYAANTFLLNEFQKYDNFIFEKIDINDIQFLYECDAVINLAASSHVGNSIIDSSDFISSNIYGVYHLLELIRYYRGEGGSKPLFYQISTDETIGDIVEGALKEDAPLKPSSPYAASKAAAETLVTAWGRTYKLPYVILRLTNNYGIFQHPEKLIPKTIKYLTLNKQIPLHNDGSPIRNWLHVNDTVRAFFTIFDSGQINTVFHVSGHFEQSNIDTVRKIIQLYENTTDVDINKYICHTTRPGQDVRYALDDTKLQQLGWLPQRRFDDELPSIVKYYKNHFIW